MTPSQRAKKLFAIVSVAALAVTACERSPTIELSRADWECTQSERYMYMTSMLIGKVMVPQYHWGSRCLQYSRVAKRVQLQPVRPVEYAQIEHKAPDTSYDGFDEEVPY